MPLQDADALEINSQLSTEISWWDVKKNLESIVAAVWAILGASKKGLQNTAVSKASLLYAADVDWDDIQDIDIDGKIDLNYHVNIM